MAVLNIKNLPDSLYSKYHWKGIDASRHVERERASWD